MVYHRSEGAQVPAPRDQEAASNQPQNAFRNDGSFLEMFKKMQEAGSSGGNSSSQSEQKRLHQSEKKDLSTADSTYASSSSNADEGLKEGAKRVPFVGKRRGGRILPTGVVKKKKTDGEEETEKPKDAWSLYMAEVRRYKESSCEEDGKTRPLVK